MVCTPFPAAIASSCPPAARKMAGPRASLSHGLIDPLPQAQGVAEDLDSVEVFERAALDLGEAAQMHQA